MIILGIILIRNAWNLEHNTENLHEILNRIMQRIMSIITRALILSVFRNCMGLSWVSVVPDCLWHSKNFSSGPWLNFSYEKQDTSFILNKGLILEMNYIQIILTLDIATYTYYNSLICDINRYHGFFSLLSIPFSDLILIFPNHSCNCKTLQFKVL